MIVRLGGERHGIGFAATAWCRPRYGGIPRVPGWARQACEARVLREQDGVLLGGVIIHQRIPL